MRSMTGFATQSTIIPVGDAKVPITLSIKSLNSRYFDTNCKIPYPLTNLETDFIRLFKSKLQRGSITFLVHLGNQNAFKGSIEPSLPVLKNYLTALDTIKKTFDLEGNLSVSSILLLPNIFVTDEQEVAEETKKTIFTITNELIETLRATQLKEGLILQEDILMRAQIIQKEISAIEHSFELLITQQKQKVNDAVVEFEKNPTLYAELQKNALYTVLDKIDVHEEIVRFKNHLHGLITTASSHEAEKGKRLDFILQELFREINTITSKCADGTISSHAINIKVELEKAREQAQNIV